MTRDGAPGGFRWRGCVTIAAVAQGSAANMTLLYRVWMSQPWIWSDPIETWGVRKNAPRERTGQYALARPRLPA